MVPIPPPAVPKYRVEMVKRPLARWYWRLKDASNGKVIAHSENYSRRTDALSVATSLAQALGTIVFVITEDRRRK